MKTFALLAGAAIALSADARAQATVRPAPSGRGIAEVVLSLPGATAPDGATPTVIRIDYGQPHLRGRKLHVDTTLVPYDRAWRTGANANTTFRTDVDLTIGGSPLAKGTYVLFTWPTAAGWKLIFQKNENQTADSYSTALDVLRIDLRRRTLPAPLESLTFWLIPSTAPGAGRGELRFAWGTTELSADWVVR
jgi:hypothetical protein